MMSRTELVPMVSDEIEFALSCGVHGAYAAKAVVKRLGIPSLHRKEWALLLMGVMEGAYINGASTPDQVAGAVADWVIEQVT